MYLWDDLLFARIRIHLNVNRSADDIWRMSPEMFIWIAGNALYGQQLQSKHKTHVKPDKKPGKLVKNTKIKIQTVHIATIYKERPFHPYPRITTFSWVCFYILLPPP